MLKQYLDQLMADLELSPPLPKDELGHFLLRLNEDLTIQIKELDPGVFFCSQIAPCPLKQREELFTLLMQANFLGQGTGGGVLSLDGEEKFLTLSLALPYDMNYKAFKDGIGDFANYVDYWKDEVKRFQ
jgi:Tir chaperone family protein CesT